MKRIVFLLVIIVMAVMNVKGQDGEWAELTPGYMWGGILSGYSSYEDILYHRRLPTKSDFEYILNNCDWQKDKGDYLVYVRNDHSQYIRLKGVEIIACGHQNVNDNYSRYCGFWSSTDDGMNYKYLLRWRVSKGNTYMTNPYIGNIGMHYDDCSATKAGVIYIIPKSDWEETHGGTYAEWYAKEKAEREAEKKEREMAVDAEIAEREAKSKAWVKSCNQPYVDLGLSSGTLWAIANVGATNPWECGECFAWGETKAKSTFFPSNYIFYRDGDSHKLIKYCSNSAYGYNGFTDSRTTLEKTDDAAYQQWGIDWCMPTQAQFQELIDECTWTWTTRNDQNGYEVKGPNGNAIFFPAAGDAGDKRHSVGSWGFYYSSSLYNGSKPFELRFNSSSIDIYDGFRTVGCSIRPVRSKGTPTNSTSSASNVSNPSQTNTPSNPNAKYVDLGLPSGTLWATCNVGAKSPWEYGDYFAWGETTTKSIYSWSNYKHGNGSNSDVSKKYNKYNEIDRRKTLEINDDAAYLKCGSDWCMPTHAQFQELYDNCIYEWVNNYQDKHVSGIIFKSKQNGNTIFFPAAGWKYSERTDASYTGIFGNYWSTSIGIEGPDVVRNLYFDNTDNVNPDFWTARHDGRSIRPVRSKK